MELYHEITLAKEYLLSRCHPSKIIVCDQRIGRAKQLLSAALCVVADCKSPKCLESELRNKIPQVPLHLTFYRPAEWSFLVRQKGTLAHRVSKTGQVLYEQTWC